MPSPTPRVFVTNENPKYNYNSAEAYGDLIFVSTGDFSYTAKSPANEELVREMEDRLKDFDPDKDSVILSGSPAVMAAALLIIGRKHSNVNILRYSSQSGGYDRVRVSVAD
jgi:hypothetical protein